MPRPIPPAPAAVNSGGFGIGERIMPFAVLRLSLFLAASAATVMAAPKALDQGRIHAYYHDGEFDKVIQSLEAFSKSGRTCSFSDSVFLEKHLAVVYAANPGTRELGRYHMFRMLDLAPGADLLDMFVGEEVDGVFDKVRKEHALRLASTRGTKREAAQSRPAPAKSSWDALPESAPAPSKTSAAAKSAALAKVSAAAPAYGPAAASAPGVTIAKAVVHARVGDPGKPAASAKPWWDVGPAATAPPAATGSARPAGHDKIPVDRASADNVPFGFHSASTPAWKEPGLWIGGAAALAVVAVSLFYSGPSETPPAKTYVVPSVPPN
jgi:hypothetical protein